MTVSVIIPVYNEEKAITACLKTLSDQSYKQLEIIIVDDGSTDKSISKIKDQISKKGDNGNFILLNQSHQGPGEARNLGAKHAKGEILVFVDADMMFKKDFIANLINPIIRGENKGTFTKDEYVANWGNVWARCWNYNQGIGTNRRIPVDYPSKAPVFRAILASEFKRAMGFDPIGYTDDWTIARKLGYQSTVAEGAICYHKNPESLTEVFRQAQWIGKNEFISGTWIRRVVNLIRFNPFVQTTRGFILALTYRDVRLFLFLWVYYGGITRGILQSALGQEKNK